MKMLKHDDAVVAFTLGQGVYRIVDRAFSISRVLEVDTSEK